MTELPTKSLLHADCGNQVNYQGLSIIVTSPKINPFDLLIELVNFHLQWEIVHQLYFIYFNHKSSFYQFMLMGILSIVNRLIGIHCIIFLS